MKILTQQVIIEQHLEAYLNEGCQNIRLMYKKIHEQTGIPKATIRKFAREYRIRLQEHLDVLNSRSKFERKGIKHSKSDSS